MLGDTITETLPQILAGVFDGDVSPLLTLIADNNADEWARSSALGALAFLTFDGRIPRDTTKAFLLRFAQDNAAPAENAAWYGWMTAVGLLGLDELSPHVHAAFEDDRIPEWIVGQDFYQELLAAASERPHDVERFREENCGYIEDVMETLEGVSSEPSEPDVFDEDQKLWPVDSGPAHNPFRHVGRNNPCPCGSGKKFKKCCLI